MTHRAVLTAAVLRAGRAAPHTADASPPHNARPLQLEEGASVTMEKCFCLCLLEGG